MNSWKKAIISSNVVKTPTVWLRNALADASKFISSSLFTAEHYKVKTSPPRVRGIEILKEPKYNKGMAFTLRERQILGIHGLLPPAFMTEESQAERVMENLRRQPHDLARYVQLNALQDRNEKLFYRVICDNVEQLMPIVYTPTVGLACQKFGFIYRRPKGLYIAIHDADHIYEMLTNWPESDVRAVVVTDGERILGLGDLGAYGMGIPIGKLSLYVALAGVQPQWCLPVLLDVGTDNEDLLDDPCYIGLRNKRIRGEKYDAFVDKFMRAVVKRFGHDTLIQFEDFGNMNAFRLLDKYKPNYCTFNDDIQGTASVVVAGLCAAVRITKKPMAENKFMFFGAGGAALGVADLLCMAMQSQGLSVKEAREKIWMMDIDGLVTTSRTDLMPPKKDYAKDYKHMTKLADIVREIKPTVLIGAGTVGGVFTEKIIRDMASFNERPIIFALSNPTSNAECTAEEAYKYSDGRVVFASGSPFPPITFDGKTFYPGQGNNAYIFPGIALGVIVCGVRHIHDELFLIACDTVAGMVSEEHLAAGRLYPPLSQVKEISVHIATAIAEHCYKEGIAAYYPEPEDKEAFIRAQLYDTAYEDFLPDVYDWPEGFSDTAKPRSRDSSSDSD